MSRDIIACVITKNVIGGMPILSLSVRAIYGNASCAGYAGCANSMLVTIPNNNNNNFL